MSDPALTGAEYESRDFWLQKIEAGSREETLWNLMRLQIKHDLADVRAIVTAYQEFLKEADARIVTLTSHLAAVDDFMLHTAELLPRLDRMLEHVQLLEQSSQVTIIDQARNARRLDDLEKAGPPVADTHLAEIMAQIATASTALAALTDHVAALDTGAAYTRIARARTNERLEALESLPGKESEGAQEPAPDES